MTQESQESFVITKDAKTINLGSSNNLQNLEGKEKTVGCTE